MIESAWSGVLWKVDKLGSALGHCVMRKCDIHESIFQRERLHNGFYSTKVSTSYRCCDFRGTVS